MCFCGFNLLSLKYQKSIIMKTNIKHLNLTINNYHGNKEIVKEEIPKDSEKMELLVETLRNIALDKFFENEEILIPDECEKFGFVQGSYKLPEFLYFIADMLEE